MILQPERIKPPQNRCNVKCDENFFLYFQLFNLNMVESGLRHWKALI